MAISLKKYIVTVQHDYGTMKILTYATSITEARENVKSYENCPDSAILAVKKITSGK